MSLRFSIGGWVVGLAVGLSAGAARAADQPLYGTRGFDLSAMDRSVRPGDDFFRYANGTWLDHHAIPPDKPAVTLRLEMTDRVDARMHGIMETAARKASHAPDDLEGKVGAFYQAFMDEAAIEAAGAKPIRPELDGIRAAASREAQAALMGRANIDFFPSLFGLAVQPDPKDPAHYAVMVSQSGLGLPDRDFYREKAFAPQKAAYLEYLTTLLRQVGWPAPEANARAVLGFETQVAEASWTRVQERDPVALYNPMSVAQLEALAPGFSWHEFLAAAGLGSVSRVIVGEKTALPKLTALFVATPIETLQAWQAARVADSAAPYLAKAFADASFAFRDRTLAGQQEPQARWKRAVTAVAGTDFLAGGTFGTWGTLGFGAGQLYTARYFGPDAKAKIEALVTQVIAAYRRRLERLDWMSPETKAQALKKLETYRVKVGYPDHPRDYRRVVIVDDDVVSDVRAAAAADWAYQTDRRDGPVDKSDWFMTPQTNDAYNGNLRDIVFPAGILQPPIFDPAADPAINYGAIGGIIGHELTHGFDDQGRKIDAAGALRDWWAKADAAKFEARAKALGAQYSAFEPLPGVHVNGDLTMAENIADSGGINLALDAYRASLGGKPAPVLDGLTGDQRVFLGWAQAWRGKVSEAYLRKQVVSDPHSPRQFRVNGPVRNVDAWYDAFDVTPDEKLYLPPDQRVHIW